MNLNQLFRRKSIDEDNSSTKAQSNLIRILGVKDLTLFGIAAIVGAGIFSTIGRAAYQGGPAVSVLFVFVAIACIFTALCYAQFASMISSSGSAYTYAYTSLGEIFAWIIGWALILEYSVSNIVISISWSGYFITMLEGFGIHWPDYLAIGYESAYAAYQEVISGVQNLPENTIKMARIYQDAPEIFGLKILINIPAGLVVTFLTLLAYFGIKESKRVNNLLVYLKIGIILFVLAAGAFFVKPENWSPFAPNGLRGVLGGVAAVFFAFVGFDSISTATEEARNPQRDMPRAMIYCLVICTLLYILIALVLTGMFSYRELAVDDPLAYVFQKVDMNMIAGIVSVSAVIAITSAILVFQIAQPRIWMAMSRDGLLSKKFGKIHSKYKTPSFATIIAGLGVGIPSLFLDMQVAVDLTSVGTFFAFILVCSGVLYLDKTKQSQTAKFRVYYINGKYLVAILFCLALYLFVTQTDYQTILREKPLLYVFGTAWLGLAIASFKNNFSLLPVLGILTNLYLMTELGWSNWLMFLCWLGIGLLIYFCYGYRKSKLSINSNK